MFPGRLALAAVAVAEAVALQFKKGSDVGKHSFHNQHSENSREKTHGGFSLCTEELLALYLFQPHLPCQYPQLVWL